MGIKLQDLKSTFSLDTNPLQKSSIGAIAVVGALVAGIGIAAKATMDWAADLDSLGDVADGTGEGLAAMTYIARKSGVGIDAVTKATFNLNKSLLKQNGTLDVAGKKLKDYGISVKDANGNVKDSVQLTDEIAKKYSELSTQQERVNFLTEIYGKAGKDMVDFFDTLAADGGIDKVAKKVKDLGLAIDPARYEQFNRNLEEMKLVGLGLAVGFTEKLMPTLERLTDWAMNKGIPGFIEFKKKMENAFKVGGIREALSVLDTEVSGWLDSLDWAGWGTRFGEQLDKALSGGIGELDLPKFATSLGSGIKSFLLTAVGEENVKVFKTHFVDYVVLQLNKLDVEVNRIVKKFLTEMVSQFKTNLSTITNYAILWVASLGVVLETRLRDIGKKFYTRAAGWVQQAVSGFTGQLPELLSVVSGLVASINAELKRIITSFRISVSLGTASTSNLGHVTPNSSGSPDDRDSNKSASVPVSSTSSESNRPLTARIPREDMYEFAMVIREMVVKGA